MPAYILTGAPGSGKTAILRMLEDVGYPVVEEAATDVIALGNATSCDTPWEEPGFIDKVVAVRPGTASGLLPLRLGERPVDLVDHALLRCRLGLDGHELASLRRYS
jgi:hypothetical protein